jgi:hypothetical protein
MQEDLLNKILIKVVDIDERIKTLATKDELNAAHSNIVGTIDHFAKLHETFDHELVATRHRYDLLEERLTLMEQKLDIQSV